MTRILLCFIAFIYFTGCSKEPINFENLSDEDGVLYKTGDKKPFTGQAIQYYDLDQKKSKLTYKKGIANGEYIFWYENGQVEEEGSFKNGQNEGLLSRWYENGQKMEEGTFNNGKLNGNTFKWFDNGQKKLEAHWVNGQQDGVEVEWYDSGNKKLEKNWVSDKLEGEVNNWYENGSMKSQLTFINGVTEGPVTMWHENGQMDLQSFYKNGKLEGKGTRWYESGQLREVVHYKDGLKDGRRKMMNELGEVIAQGVYRRDTLLSDIQAMVYLAAIVADSILKDADERGIPRKYFTLKLVDLSYNYSFLNAAIEVQNNSGKHVDQFWFNASLRDKSGNYLAGSSAFHINNIRVDGIGIDDGNWQNIKIEDVGKILLNPSSFEAEGEFYEFPIENISILPNDFGVEVSF